MSPVMKEWFNIFLWLVGGLSCELCVLWWCLCWHLLPPHFLLHMCFFLSDFHFALLRYDWILFSILLLLLLLPPSIILPSSPQTDDSTGLQTTHNAHTGGWAVEPTLMSLRALTASLAHVNWNPEKKSTPWPPSPNHHLCWLWLGLMAEYPVRFLLIILLF